MSLRLWKQAAAYGVVLWLVAFLVIILLVVAGLRERPLAADIVLLLVALFVAWPLAARLPFVSLSQGMLAGLVWIGENVLLDVLILVKGFTVPFSFFTLWVVWGRYLILLVVPALLSLRKYAK